MHDEAGAQRQDFTQLLLTWALRCVLAAAFLTIVEVGATALHFSVVFSDAPGALHWGLYVWWVFTISLLPSGAVLALLQWRGVRVRLPESALVAACLLGGGVVSVAVVALVSFFEGHPANEFPVRTQLLRNVVILAAIMLGFLVTLWGVLPGCRWLWPRFELLRRPSVLPTFVLLVGSVVCSAAIHLAIAPIHLYREVLIFASIAAWLALLAAALIVSLPASPYGRTTVGVVLALLLVLPTWSSRDVHARFALFGHSHAAGALASLWRDVFDWDDDGSVSVWLGGNDCSEWDANRAPALREVIGDGIDQDCSGGDAAAPPSFAQAVAFPGCPPPGEKLDVILLTIDALRGDLLQPEVMPRLSRLAAGSIAFRRSYSPATNTRDSMAAVFAAKPMSDIAAQNVLTDTAVHIGRPLADRFASAGYHTVVFEEVPLPAALRTGFIEHNPGRHLFDSYPAATKTAFSAAGVTTMAIAALDRPRQQPTFTWLHYVDAHAPYVAPQRFELPEELSDYEGAVRYVDAHVGRLLADLQLRGLLQRTIIAVTSDHGEDLGLRGREGHGPDVYESSVHVPLLLWVPGCAAADVSVPVSLTQLGPTLGKLVGVDVPGRTLMPSESDLPVVAEVTHVLGQLKRAVIGERFKLIVDVRNGGRMLFDLAEDPGETRNVYRHEPDAAAALELAYQRWLDSPGAR